MKKTFYAVHGIEVVPCHLVAKKDRTNGQKYAANSKRDKRRFQSAYAEAEDAHKEAKENEIKTIAMINTELLKRAHSLLESYNNWNGDDYDATAALLDDMGTFMNDLISAECPVTNKTKTYYQPEGYYDDGTNIEYGDIPEELHSFEAFPSREECREWLKNHDYEPGDFVIKEYHDDDIEGVTILDGYGNVIETNEEE